MKSRLNHVKHFEMISDFLKGLGQGKMNTIDAFHITTFSMLNRKAPMEMPPYTKDFYQINFITKAHVSNIRLDDKDSELVNNTLYFVSPQHIYSWRRAKNIEGYLIYFKKDFLDFFKPEFNEEFEVLFDIKADNVLELDKREASKMSNFIRLLFSTYNNDDNFKSRILGSNLVSLLYVLKGIELRKYNKAKNIQTNKIIRQFRNLVRNKFIVEKTVRYYAKQLSVSPNYLNELSKKERLVSPKQYIQDMVVQEAKNLLVYSKKDIAEIAYHLGYEEPTHFTRFFKAQTRSTPLAFRKEYS